MFSQVDVTTKFRIGCYLYRKLKFFKKIIFRWCLNRYNLMILIRCYYLENVCRLQMTNNSNCFYPTLCNNVPTTRCVTKWDRQDKYFWSVLNHCDGHSLVREWLFRSKNCATIAVFGQKWFALPKGWKRKLRLTFFFQKIHFIVK